MQQRVGLARALAVDPEIMLCDEPFSALDPLIRRDMQDELLNLQQSLRKTIIFITHDFLEAIKLGDRIAIMKDGEAEKDADVHTFLSNKNYSSDAQIEMLAMLNEGMSVEEAAQAWVDVNEDIWRSWLP